MRGPYLPGNPCLLLISHGRAVNRVESKQILQSSGTFASLPVVNLTSFCVAAGFGGGRCCPAPGVG
eukprot:8141641-Pyramimonas_sp.AAC.1